MSAALSTPTDSQATNVAATPAQTPATPAVEQKSAPEKATQQQPTTADQVLSALKQAEGGEKSAEPTKEAEKAAPAAPEKYEPWKLAEGVKLSDDINGEFSQLARKAGLSQADAQASLDKLVAAQQSQLQSDLKSQVESWGEELNKDPELGGANLLTKTMPAVQKALNAFDKSGKVAALLKNGLGVHPDVVRMFAEIGTAVSEPADLVTGQRFAPRTATVNDLYEATKVN